jgi:hypothetical protein
MVVGKPVFVEFGTRAYPDTTKNILSRMFSTLVGGDQVIISRTTMWAPYTKSGTRYFQLQKHASFIPSTLRAYRLKKE